MNEFFVKIKTFFLKNVTQLGWVLLAVSFLGLLIGIIFTWIELIFAGLAAALLIAFALPFLFGKMPFEINFGISKNRIVAGQEITADIFLKNPSEKRTLPAALDIPVNEKIFSIPIKSLPKNSSHTKELRIPAHKRGVLQVGPAKIVRADPLQIFKRERLWNKKFTVFVHPITVQLNTVSTGARKDLDGQASKHVVRDDLSFHAIRQWQTGDLKRQIHWKSTAKTGSLMVKEFEETRTSDTIIVFDALAENYLDQQEFELSVSAAASVALLILHQTKNVEVVHTDDKRVLSIKAHKRTSLLDQFSNLESTQTGYSLLDSAKFVAQNTAHPSMVIFLTGSKTTSKQLNRLKHVFSGDTQILIVRSDALGAPSLRKIDDSHVASIGILQDLRQLLMRI